MNTTLPLRSEAPAGALPLPRVSVIVPCRNEVAFIRLCLDSIVGTDYPTDRLEVWVVDGMSEDGTRAAVEEYARRHPFVHVLDNPRHITAVALNLGITRSSGEIVLWMSAHNRYPTDYISRCVEELRLSGADNVGGIIITLPREQTLTGSAIVAALSHRFGVGNSYFRIRSTEPRWVDTVFGGAYRREVFQDVGLFNEQLIRGQDMEFNLRLKRAGKRTLLVPSIISYYYARTTFRSFWAHNWSNGIWAVKPFQYSRGFPVSWRHLTPLALMVSLLGTAVLGFAWHPAWWGFLTIAATYAAVMLGAAIDVSIRQGDPRFLALMPLTFLALHVPYGLGSIAGAAELVATRLIPLRRVRIPTTPRLRPAQRVFDRTLETLPRVSVVIPCRREVRYIRDVLQSVLQTTYPLDRLEILLVDGMSNDGTREVVNEIARRHPVIRLLDNPRKIIPAALNIGITDAAGDIVVRMDAHTIYPPDYIMGCVRGLLQTGADSVGGATTVVPTDPTIPGRAIALALSHPFGVGNALHRLAPSEPTETDTVPFGCMWRSRLIEIGLYDERFARSEDMEFNTRLRAAGGRIFLLPEIKSFYYARSELTSFARHCLSNGYWALYPIAFGPLPTRPRHVIPLCFVLGLVLPSLGTFWWPNLHLISVVFGSAYIATNLGVSAVLAARQRAWGLIFVLPLVFAALHVLYGLGSAVGLVRGIWRRLIPSRVGPTLPESGLSPS